MPKNKKWYKIQAKDDSAEISIFGDIGYSWWGDSVTAADFQKDFDKIKDKAQINVLINSEGGDVFEGITIHNIIASKRDKVTVEVMGLAASAASVIALSGKELFMREGSMLMIHNVWTFAFGNANDLREQADTLDKVSNQLVNIYEAHSDLSAEEIKDFMDAETWFTASEAVEYGFADEEITDKIAASISIDPRKYAYKHIPEGFRDVAEGNIQPPETVREFEALLRDAGYSRKQSETIAANGFETAQGDPGAEADQGDPEPAEEGTDATPEVVDYSILLRLRENKSFSEGLI